MPRAAPRGRLLKIRSKKREKAEREHGAQLRITYIKNRGESMSVKIIHAADFHLDSPFDALPAEKAELRRAEQRELIRKIVSAANDEGADLILLSGDLFDSDVSYHETGETLREAFADTEARVFIAPGNHDYFCLKSPYSYVKFPENVHIFQSPAISCVDIPELNCRVWGAGFCSPLCEPMLTGFSCPTGSMTDIMVMHGELGGGTYNRISAQEIADSGLDYLALGHVHSFSGIMTVGETSYAYPGCPEGRGFDETGAKGIIAGSVGKGVRELRFVPLGGREYGVLNVDMTGSGSVYDALDGALPENAGRDIYRVNFTGECGERVDIAAVREAFGNRFFHAVFADKTVRPGDIWQGAGENSLRGVFLRRMKRAFDEASDSDKGQLEAAVRYALAAIDRREGWRP